MKQEYTVLIESPAGLVLVSADEQNITSIRFAKTKEILPEKIQAPLPSHVEQCIDELKEYFDGKRKSFTFPMSQKGSDFQNKIWNALMEIPYGETSSYKELALRFGNANLSRAIGGANRKNKLWIVVPCHRVIGKDGNLVGYAGGLHLKHWLLEHEQKNM